MIIFSVGMAKAGSAWFFNMTNDLLVCSGHSETHTIREQYHLDFLSPENCRLDSMTPEKLIRLSIPHFQGKTFVVKSHYRPNIRFKLLVKAGIAKIAYIYRDPRDVLISLMDHAQKMRDKGKTSSFASLDTLDKTIDYVLVELKKWEGWYHFGDVYMVKYEDLVGNTLNTVRSLCDYIEIHPSDEKLLHVINTYRPQKAAKPERGEQKRLHFNKGIIGRYKSVLSTDDVVRVDTVFEPYIRLMGYNL